MAKNTTIHTYLNRNGKPIIRRCNNCIFWRELSNYDNRADNAEIETGITEETAQRMEQNNEKREVGCCANMPLLFSITMLESRYALTKPFDLCEKHLLANEEFLKRNNAERVLQADIVVPATNNNHHGTQRDK